MNGTFEMTFEQERDGVNIAVHASIRDVAKGDEIVRICAVRELVRALRLSTAEIGAVVFALMEDDWPDGGSIYHLGGDDDARRC